MTTPRTEQRCGNCYCFVPAANPDIERDTCRANPPIADNIWPPVETHKWCAKWLQGDQK